jgi:alpha-amylase
MSRTGTVHGANVQLTKGITLHEGESTVRIGYLLEGLPLDHSFHFAPEFNFSGLPADVDDRFFYGENGDRLGHLGMQLDLHDLHQLGLVDEWLGIDVQLQTNRPTSFWTYPIETVSQSEGGFELVHQSVVVQPHWWVRPDPKGKWSVTVDLQIDTSAAQEQVNHEHELATSE